MTTVRFAYYLNNERHHESLAPYARKWFCFAYPFKIGNRQILAV